MLILLETRALFIMLMMRAYHFFLTIKIKPWREAYF